jgi:hypothetical protein
MAVVRDNGGSFYLRSPAEYRKLAQNSIRVVEAAGIPRDKALSAVSQTWLRLAEEAEARQSSRRQRYPVLASPCRGPRGTRASGGATRRRGSQQD